MTSVITMFLIRGKEFRRKSPMSRLSVLGRDQCVASTSIARMGCSHQGAPGLGSFIFIPKFFGLPDTPLVHSFCIADGSPNNQQLWQFGYFVVGERQRHVVAVLVLIPSPEMCMVSPPSVFSEKMRISLLIANDLSSLGNMLS